MALESDWSPILDMHGKQRKIPSSNEHIYCSWTHQFDLTH